MGVYVKDGRCYYRLKGPDGKWVNKASTYRADQKEQAEKALDAMVRSIAAGTEIFGKRATPVTVKEYCAAKWFIERRKTISDWKSDEARMGLHVFPGHKGIGEKALREIKPRHLVDLFSELRAKKKEDGSPALAPKSIYNIYGVLKALFRDAIMDELVAATPCVLDARHLGPNEDADPEWRDTALYSRAELEALISDPRIPTDRQVLYALQGLGAARAGEADALRWKHYDPSMADAATGALGRLTIAKSHAKDHTKTGRARAMPVHPVLASLLAEWKLSGWPAMMGRQPTPEDLIVPMPAPTKGKGYRAPLGSMRTNSITFKALRQDLQALGFRHRRGHDLRRTFITWAQEDGASQIILEQCTHTPKKAKAIGGYTTYTWPVRSREVAKLKISRNGKRSELLAFPVAIGAPVSHPNDSAPLPSQLVTKSLRPMANHLENIEQSTWRRRESNPATDSVSEGSGSPSSEESANDSRGAASARGAGRVAEKARRSEVRNDVTSGLVAACEALLAEHQRAPGHRGRCAICREILGTIESAKRGGAR